MKNHFLSNFNYLIHERKDICNQNQLALKLGVRRQTIHSYAIGDGEPSFENLIIICESYGITPNDILLRDLRK